MKMIMSRSPLRLTLGGGGTDLPWYADEYGGFVISAAINKHVFVTLNKNVNNNIVVKINDYEEVDNPIKLKNYYIKTILNHYQVAGIKIKSFTNVPSYYGLGYNGSLSIGVLKVLNQYLTGKTIYPDESKVKMVYDIESKMGGGIQDPAISEYGGIIKIKISPNYVFNIKRITLKQEIIDNLNKSIMVFNTGIMRSEYEVLKDQGRRKRDEYFHEIKNIGEEIFKALINGDIKLMGKLTTQHWNNKKLTSPLIYKDINKYVDKANELGADGAKIAGAGGGGYIMVFATDPDIRKKINDRIKLSKVSVKFGVGGSKIIHDDGDREQ